MRKLLPDILWMRERFAAWERRATPFWEERHWAAILLTIYLPAAWLAYAWFFAPSPGVAGMVFGGFTVVIFFLRELTALQRLFCMLLVWGFVAVEVKSINKDRDAQNKQHTDDLNLQKAQSQAFEKQMQDDFNQTVSHMEKVFGETETVLNDLTGGDSFPEICPQDNTGFYFVTNGRKFPAVPLGLVVRGKYPLSDISLKFSGTHYIGEQPFEDLFNPPQVKFGTLPPVSMQPLNVFLEPDWDEGEVSSYQIQIGSRSAGFVEVLFLRKGKSSSRWAYKYIVLQMASPIKVLKDVKWSDEPAIPGDLPSLTILVPATAPVVR